MNGFWFRLHFFLALNDGMINAELFLHAVHNRVAPDNFPTLLSPFLLQKPGLQWVSPNFVRLFFFGRFATTGKKSMGGVGTSGGW